MRTFYSLCLLVLMTLPGWAQVDARSLLRFEVAARRGEMKVVQEMLEQGLDPLQRDINGSTAAHYAATGGQVEILRMLLDRGVPVDAPDERGHRPLYEAAVANSAECVRLLLERGAKVDATTVGDWTALQAALVWGRDQAAKALIEGGARLDRVEGRRDETSLMLAARRGSASMVRLLLERGAPFRKVTSEGRTALHYAALGGEAEVVSLLLEAGLEPEHQDSQGRSPLVLALQGRHQNVSLLLLEVVEDASAVLPSAAAWGSSKMVQGLLSKGVSREALAEAVVVAAGRRLGKRFAEPDTRAFGIVERLLQAGAPVGVEALCAASRVGHLHVVELLLDHGADVDGRDPRGDNPLLLAAENGSVGVVRLLLERGALRDSVDAEGRGALERVEMRMKSLVLVIERLGRKRCLDPAEASARRQLEHLRRVRGELASLLS